MGKKIKLMADYQCWPVWDMDDPDNIDPRDLPLSDKTIEGLIKWEQSFDAILDWDDPVASGFESEEAAVTFEQEGIRLWLQLRQELAPDYEVHYFSNKLNRLLTDPNKPTDIFTATL